MRFEYRAAGPVAAAAVAMILLAACSRVQQDWRVAQKADNPQAYRVFAASHPQSELAAVARQRIAQLTEQAAWQQAMRADTAAAYRDYLGQYPNGSWSQDARIRMESRSLAAAASASDPAAAGPTASAAAPAHTNIATPNTETPIADSVGVDTTVGSSAVQLGAFSNAANARAAWSQLSLKFGAELQGLEPRVLPVTVGARRLYRLEAMVASQAAAYRLCRQLQQRSQACLPLP